MKLTENKYNLKSSDIKKLKILDWDRLKGVTWYNQAMAKSGEWYCHLDGSGKDVFGDAEDEFWIGFNKKNDKIDFHFTSYGGMCSFKFKKFYDSKDDLNKWGLEIQSKALEWLNSMIDEGILGREQTSNTTPSE